MGAEFNNPPKMSFPEFKAAMEEYERSKRKNLPPSKEEMTIPASNRLVNVHFGKDDFEILVKLPRRSK